MPPEGEDKTYVWAKLAGGGQFRPSSPRSGGGRAKKRGAPTANADGSSDVWGWAPGYYRAAPASTSSDEGGGGAGAGDAVGYHLTLLGSPRSDGEPLRESEHALEKSFVATLFESGDLVLANPWEVHDFVHRLSLSGGDPEGGKESESDEEDSDRGDMGGPTSSFVDASDTSPPSNLIELTHLHEPSVVHALRHRYDHAAGADMSGIYTDTGPILLAVNPFKRDASGRLYGDDTVAEYRREGEGRWLEECGGGGDDKRPTAAGAPRGTEKPLPPHVYGVADRTFRLMMTRLHPPLDVGAANSSKGKDPSESTPQCKINQSVLVSGESGAGKTWTTKLLMAYLSKLSENVAVDIGSSGSDSNQEMSIERRILESNPIMESFGNARTIRNDNSSRFGKYIEMNFESKGGRATLTPNVIPGAMLTGASIETYLLEKVRLVHQAPGERNYHIFYELFSMKDDCDDSDSGGEEKREDAERTEDVLEKIGLLDYDIEDFRLLNTASDTYDRRDGVTDDETFRDMKRAMRIMGFSPEEMASVFEVTAALLHFSNLTFDLIGEVECRLVMDNPHLEHVVDLLGITKEGLNQALCYYEITIGGHGQRGGETHKRELSQEQAEKGIEALIKATYGAMFDYLVQQINKSVAVNVPGDASERKEQRKKRRGKVVKAASIGILDIFGFESFQTNSFEQLCINYCNEALQQQFNLFVLRNEQEEYDREGIPWSFIEFPDNQDVLDLISFKTTGILNILHDQCRTPGASDENFALAIYGKCSSHKRFEADSRQVGELLFGIHHYAGLVEYTVEGFVEKTRDDLPKSGSDLLSSSSNDFVKTIAVILQPGLPSPGAKNRKLMSASRTGGAGQRPTVGIQFSSQLQSLRSKIDETSPHYIRCVKPNNHLVPDQFDAALVADQLRCAGVIEAVRVSRLGYPQRFAHSQFCGRYRVLGKTQAKKNKKITAKNLVHSIGEQLKEGTDDVGIQCGKTKVFLRRKAYDLLERLRKEKLASAAITIQKIGRKLVYSRKFVKAICAVITLQCFIRTFWAKITVFERRQQHNAIILQAAWRKSKAMTRFISAKTIACWCQTHARGSSGRRRYNELKRNVKAKYLQSQWRCYQALKTFHMYINAILIIQCARRCYSSRRVLRARKSEARNLSNVVQERDKFRQEAKLLRNELECMRHESVLHQEKMAQAVNCGNTAKLREKDAEIESLGNALEQLKTEKENADNELEEVKEMLKTLRSERNVAVNNLNDLKQINKQLQSESDSREQQLSSQVDSLVSTKKELEELKELIANVDNSAAQERQKFMSTKNTQENELNNELTDLEESNASLQADNDQLKAENATLLEKNADLTKAATEMREEPTKTASLLSETSKSKKSPDKRSMVFDESTAANVDEKTMTLEERSRNGVNPSVCTSVTADMDVVNEEEMVKLREENQVLRKQLEFLRVTNEFQCIPDEDQDDSLADSKSDMSEYIEEVEATNVPDSVMKQILSEVEIVTEEVIIKTRAESEAKIAELNGKIESLKAEKEEDKKNARYDLDDMTRVNRSLRHEIEAINEEKDAIEEELEEKCDEFDALNEDVERFAETFAAQHAECQQLEGQVRNLLLENKKLTSAVADSKKIIRELEGRLEAKNEVGSELGKLWEEVERLKTSSISSPPIKQVDEPYFSLNSTASDISR